MTLSQAEPIADLDELRLHLQFAIGLELATIPLYLTALYSIPDGDNTAASRVIQSVAIEEMLHMALAANVLNGIGGAPSPAPIGDLGSPIPHFPTEIPFLPGLGELNLRRFSPQALETFLEVEHPRGECAPPPRGYGSIGAFYGAIIQGIEDHASDEVFERAAVERAGCQIKAPEFYGGAGKLIEVRCKATAIEALREIVRQGEGIEEEVLSEPASAHGVRPAFLPEPELDLQHRTEATSVDDGDVLADGWKMYSHFARFKELMAGRRYLPDQTIEEQPRGDVLPIDWGQVFPMLDNPTAAAYEGTEVEPVLHRFNDTYTKVIDGLYAAFNGDAKQFQEAVVHMWTLKGQAVALMKTPSPLEPHRTVGAPFEYQG